MRTRTWIAFALSLALLPLSLRAVRGDGPPAEPPADSGALKAGDPAPPVTAKAWLNTKDGASPLGEAAAGKPVLVEFWGTWCGPCVRAMPHIQSLFERYGGRGLAVVGITREESEPVRGFLADNKYTLPIGCDPEQTTVKAYRIKGWPSTFVIGKDGNLVYAGDPYGCEAAVEKALGLESGPKALLTAYLDAAKAGEAKALREAFERLTEKSPPAFDLKAWALGALGSEPPAATTPPKVDGAKALEACLSAWKSGDAAKRTAALTPVAQAGPADFDLKTWARAGFGKSYPATKDELSAALDGGRFEAALDLLLHRNASAALAAQAAKHAGFTGWCKSKRDGVRADARRGLMAIHYVFPGEPLGRMDQETQKRFWQDLSVSGMSTDAEQKRILGLLIGGEPVMKEEAPGYVRDHLEAYALMTSFVDGKPLKGPAVAAEAKKEEDAIVAELKRKY